MSRAEKTHALQFELGPISELRSTPETITLRRKTPGDFCTCGNVACKASKTSRERT